MIKVVDAIMGSGKSSAAIQVMRNNPDRKYIIITPYIEETKRFKNALPQLEIKTPDKMQKYNGSKSMHLDDLIDCGCNVAITHSLFALISNTTCNKIIYNKYTIIIDEAVDVFGELPINDSDYQMIIGSEFVTETTTDEERIDGVESFQENQKNKYSSGRFKDIFNIMRTSRLIGFSQFAGSRSQIAYYWMMSRRMFELADEIYILTYMFDGSILKRYLDYLGLSYVNIGVLKDENGEYHFVDDDISPGYVKNIKSLITVVDSEKMNDIGKSKTALSKNWFAHNTTHMDNDKIERLRKNVCNFFINYGSKKSEQRMWSTFKSYRHFLRGKGYTNRAVEINARATNEYAEVTALAYCANIFLHPVVKQFFNRNGCPMDEDMYSLSILVQWIWRSAIRNGKEITVYIPSKRMRKLFTDWLDRLQDGEQR